jgi:hypothetical protein
MVQQTRHDTLYIDAAARHGRRISDRPPALPITRGEIERRLAAAYREALDRECAYQIAGGCPPYDPADYPGFTRQQIERDLTVRPILNLDVP